MLVQLGCQRRLGWKVVPLSSLVPGHVRVQELSRMHTLRPGDLVEPEQLARCGPVEVPLQAVPIGGCCLVPLPRFLGAVVAEAPGDDELVAALRKQGQTQHAAELLIYVQRRPSGPLGGAHA